MTTNQQQDEIYGQGSETEDGPGPTASAQGAEGEERSGAAGDKAGPDDSWVSAVYTVAVVMPCDCGKHILLPTPNAVELGLSGAGIRTRCESCGSTVLAQPAPSSPRLGMAPPNRKMRRAQQSVRRSKGGILLP